MQNEEIVFDFFFVKSIVTEFFTKLPMEFLYTYHARKTRQRQQVCYMRCYTMFPCEKVFQKKSFNGQKIPTAKSNYIQPLFLSSKWEEKQHCIGSSIKYSRSLSLENHGINYKSNHFIVESFTLDFQRFIFPVQ